MSRARLATVWLGGCSGCHMSFLDMDEWLFDLAEQADIVYGPFVDAKVFPAEVDIALVEGAVANSDNLEMIHQVRERTRTVVSFGDCAVTGNVTALRNPLGDPAEILARVYVGAVDRNPTVPDAEGIVPTLLPRAQPVHRVIDVDVWLPGCPPPADRIRTAVSHLLAGGASAGLGDDIRFG